MDSGWNFSAYLSSVLCLLLVGCGGGNSNSSGTPPPQNLVATIGSLSPSVIAAKSPDTTITLTGTNFLSLSKVNLNGSPLATSFISSTQLTASISSASLIQEGTYQITVVNPSPGGGTSTARTLAVTAIGPFTIMAAPENGGVGSNSWQLSISASDNQGNSVQGLQVSMATSEGTLSQSQGVTDSSGTLTASISPPTSYSGEAVAVSATIGTQTAALNIAFVPSVFSPSSMVHQEAQIQRNSASGTGLLTVPFVFGVSSAPGSSNPFVNPSLCYTQVDLDSTVPLACQSAYASQGIVQAVLDGANSICKAGGKIADAAGAVSCGVIVATIVSCAAAPTGIGAVICTGGLTYSGVLSALCLNFLTDVIAKEIAPSPTDKVVLDQTVISIQPGAPSPDDEVGLVCDAIDAAAVGIGMSSSGTQITLTPPRTTVLLGSSVQLSAALTGNANPNVTWSVNGIAQGAGPFGTVTSGGFYTAPSTLPTPNHVTVAATSVADGSASAPAIVTVAASLPGTIVTVAGTGITGYSGDNGPAINAQLSTPTGIAFDRGGNMFIADFGNNVIRKVTVSTDEITTIAGTGIAGYSGDAGPGTAAKLNGPTHVVFDRTINLYITDANNERIRRVDSITDEINTIAGNGVAGYSGDGDLATNAQLNFPDGVALDVDGNIFIGDALNNRVRRVALDSGQITTAAGNGVSGYSGDGGLATSAALNFPSRPFIDTNGNMYIADFQNNRVRKVDSATGIITTIAGTGVAGYSGDGGPATNAQLNGPLSVALDPIGVLYIADVNNERIRAVNLGAEQLVVLGVTIQPGEIETVVGSGSVGYLGDGGPATIAKINNPTGLIVDSVGNLYFADSRNNVIRKVIGR